MYFTNFTWHQESHLMSHELGSYSVYHTHYVIGYSMPIMKPRSLLTETSLRCMLSCDFHISGKACYLTYRTGYSHVRNVAKLPNYPGTDVQNWSP